MKKVLYQMGKVLLFLLPLVLGMIGLWVLGEVPLLDALFSCINMYVLNYGDTPENVFVELARWLAPITTVSGIVLALRSIRDQVRCLVRYCLGDGVAVYGPVESRDLLVAQLGRHGIQGGDKLLPARQYILLGRCPAEGQGQLQRFHRITCPRPGGR